MSNKITFTTDRNFAHALVEELSNIGAIDVSEVKQKHEDKAYVVATFSDNVDAEDVIAALAESGIHGIEYTLGDAS